MFKKIYLSMFSLLFFALASSCSNYGEDDGEFRTIPVTNNPLIVPDSGSSIPGMPSSNPM